MGKHISNILRTHGLIILGLVVVASLVYAPSLRHEFLFNWDDSQYVVDNEVVKGFSPDHLRAAFSRYFVGNYAPLQIVSYMFDYTLWGVKPAGFILTNILLHALNGILFYFLLFRMTGDRLWSSIAAFIFLFHPLQVESVAWISQRKNVLSMFFFLISFHAYYDYLSHEFRSLRAYALSLITFFMALLTKSVAIVMPLALVLLEGSAFHEKRGEKHRSILPFILVAALFAAIAIVSQSNDSIEGLWGYQTGSPLNTFYTMLPVFARYLALFFWPEGLSAIYAPTIKTGIDTEIVLAAMLMLMLVAAGVCLYRRRRDLFFWFALFFVGFLPVSQIIPMCTLMNDRYYYFPMLGMAALCGGIIASLGSSGRPFRRNLAVVPVLFALVTLPFLSWQRTAVWQDAISLWSDVTLKDSDGAYGGYASFAQDALAAACFQKGKMLQNAGRDDDALAYYQKALSADPFLPGALNNIGVLLMKRGNYRQSRVYLVRVTKRFPRYFSGFVNLGNNYAATGDFINAETAYRKALKLWPQSAVVLSSLGNLYLVKKQYGDARRFLEKAKETGFKDANLEYDLARLYAQIGDHAAALRLPEKSPGSGFSNVSDTSKHSGPNLLRPHAFFRYIVE
jgi:hypothetical protein